MIYYNNIIILYFKLYTLGRVAYCKILSIIVKYVFNFFMPTIFSSDTYLFQIFIDYKHGFNYLSYSPRYIIFVCTL